MLLQCEIHDGNASAVTGAASALRATTLESLFELNEGCLGLMAEQARLSGDHALLGQFAEQWRMLDAAGRRRAATCHYLLLDAGFAEARRWQRPAAEAGAAMGAAFFSVAGAAGLLQAVCVFGWHLARCHGSAAQLLLGMPAACVNLLAQRTLGQVRGLSAAHPEWLRPRWLRHPRVWRGLLAAAQSDDPAALWRAQLHGQTLLAAETRAYTEPLRLAPAFPRRRGPLMAAEAAPRSAARRPQGPQVIKST
jgi:hypothetical protein